MKIKKSVSIEKQQIVSRALSNKIIQEGKLDKYAAAQIFFIYILEETHTMI